MHDRSDRRYLKRSLGLSIGLHFFALPAVVAMFWSTQWGSDTSLGSAFEKRETATVSYLRIEHRAAPPRAPARARERALPPPLSPRRVVLLERPKLAHRATVHTIGPAVQITVAALPLHVAKRTAVVALAQPERVLTLATAAPGPAPAISPTSTPLPTISATPAVIAEDTSARGSDVPLGGWGQTFEHPLIADDSALDDLRAHYHAVSRATIEVDETGKPLRVMLPAGLADDVRADLERALMDLRYVPAECNGLHCAGTLELIL